MVVATDGTPSSRAAVEKGLSMAEELGARVTFVSAYRPPWAALGKPFYERSLSKRLAVAREALDEAKTVSEAFGTDADYAVVEGKPASAIARLAAARDADLVVVGSRDLTTPVAALCGSVLRSLVGQSDRAVLVAKDGRRGKSRALSRSLKRAARTRETIEVHRASAEPRRAQGRSLARRPSAYDTLLRA